MRIPADIRVSVYVGLVLGFSRRLLRRVLEPVWKNPVPGWRWEDACLCMSYRGKWCYWLGPWSLSRDLFDGFSSLLDEYSGRLPSGMRFELRRGGRGSLPYKNDFFRDSGLGVKLLLEVNRVCADILDAYTEWGSGRMKEFGQ